MASTRSEKGSAKSTPASGTKTPAKRPAAAQSSLPAKRGRPSKKAKQQKTIEETVDGFEDDKDVAEKINSDAEDHVNGNANDGTVTVAAEGHDQDQAEGEDVDADKGVQDGEKNAFDEVKADAGEVKKAAEQEQEEKSETIANNAKSIINDETREAAIPSSILEKGIVYFVFRARVGIEEPEGIEDVARSFIVLRPLPLGAKLGEGPLEDTGNARLLALPKKVLPTSGKNRFLVFVEEPSGTIQDLRKKFAGEEYATKTSGYVSFPWKDKDKELS
jgi:hypothetical protein